MKQERMFARFDVVHTCTSETDKLWSHEILVDASDKDAVKNGFEELQEAFRKHNTCHADVLVWTEDKEVVRETDSNGIFYKEWDSVSPATEVLNGNTPKHWSSCGVLRIVRPLSYIRNSK